MNARPSTASASRHSSLGSPKEVAAYLQVSEPTLTTWRYHRSGPTFLRVGKHVRYRWNDVEAWLDAQVQNPQGAA